MAGAFQQNAFQNNAFQVGGPAPIPPQAGSGGGGGGKHHGWDRRIWQQKKAFEDRLGATITEELRPHVEKVFALARAPLSDADLVSLVSALRDKHLPPLTSESFIPFRPVPDALDFDDDFMIALLFLVW